MSTEPGPATPESVPTGELPAAVPTDALNPGPANPAAAVVPAVAVEAPLPPANPATAQPGAMAASPTAVTESQPSTRRWTKAERKRKRFQAVLFLLMTFATVGLMILCGVLYYMKFVR